MLKVDTSDSLPVTCDCNALRKAARRVTQLYDRALTPSGLGVNQYAILSELKRQDGKPIGVGQLARAMVMDRSALGHNLRPLERERLVTLGVNAEDRRSKAITLTPTGRQRLENARQYWRQAQERFQQAFAPEELLALRTLAALVAATDFAEIS